ncbi:histidinol-phosphate transaminase [Dongshaea marina]|uniref:histidinol-phosphate transaminase n=1 Tax=Dongshaea marina TaxID=2047966 RepID=UPI000D3E3155|nr:histidinol-phosphate transaminase [Dongshaea marina]
MSVRKLLRPGLRDFKPYQSARRIGGDGELWLNANESPFNPIGDASELSLNRYPEPQPEGLLQDYADYAGVTPSQLICCRGADEGIELLIRSFCVPGSDSILYCPPTYGMYQVSGALNGVSCKEVPLTADGQLDLKEIEAQLPGVKLLFLCRPNNPTGNCFREQDIRKVLELCTGRALVVLDEAYIEFCPEKTLCCWLKEYPELVILRTLSKAFSLAGIRCGFVLGSPELISILKSVIAPYPVPTPVCELARRALSEKAVARMREQVKLLCGLRDALFGALSTLPDLKAFPSEANFVLLESPRASCLFEFLSRQGIIVRKMAHPGQLRLSVGSQAECEQLISAISQWSQEPSYV